MTSQPDEQHAFFGITAVKQEHDEQPVSREEAIQRIEFLIRPDTPRNNAAFTMAVAALRSEGDLLAAAEDMCILMEIPHLWAGVKDRKEPVRRLRTAIQKVTGFVPGCPLKSHQEHDADE